MSDAARGAPPALDGSAAHRDGIGALRDAREQLRLGAARGEEHLVAALGDFVRAAWDAGFSRMTTCSMAVSALEEGLPRVRRRPVRERAAAWEPRVGALYDALGTAPGRGEVDPFSGPRWS